MVAERDDRDGGGSGGGTEAEFLKLRGAQVIVLSETETEKVYQFGQVYYDKDGRDRETENWYHVAITKGKVTKIEREIPEPRRRR